MRTTLNDATLDSPTLAKIYIGAVTSWDDASINALNPKLTSPATPIAEAHCADGCGATFSFTNNLATVSSGWQSKVAERSSVDWPTAEARMDGRASCDACVGSRHEDPRASADIDGGAKMIGHCITSVGERVDERR